MYYITDFCRVCLQYDKTLIDIMKKEKQVDILNKLKLCVSEVEWSKNKSLLMCPVCLEKLNSAFEFKRLCLQSTETLENYLSELMGQNSPGRVESRMCVSVSRSDVSEDILDNYLKTQKDLESQTANTFIRVKSNQQLYPTLATVPNNIFVTSGANQSAFQNIFLNLIPTTSLTKYATPNFSYGNRPPSDITKSQVKDFNQSMFLNINNTLHKIYPVIAQNKENYVTPPNKDNLLNQALNRAPNDVNISQILTESKTEEVSVEIDPACFDCMPEDDPISVAGEASENTEKDWDELISSSKIVPEPVNNSIRVPKYVPSTSSPALSRMLDRNYSFVSHNNIHFNNVPNPANKSMAQNNVDVNTVTSNYNNIPMGNFVPIRPKVKEYINPELDEKVNYFLGNHFMAYQENSEPVKRESTKTINRCEQCGEICDTIKSLRYHIKMFHMGKFPYKCKYCFSEYALRNQYQLHMRKHLLEPNDTVRRDTITLEDLSHENVEPLMPPNDPNSSNTVQAKLATVQGNPNNVSTNSDLAESGDEDPNGAQCEHQCDACPRSFASAHGLSRHKVRKHNEKTRKKYFIKGMKNAKCDICNREFSTQSYLQLHIKLHYRKSDYRRKVFHKATYNKENGDENETTENENLHETKEDGMEVSETAIDVTDISSTTEQNDTIELNENKEIEDDEKIDDTSVSEIANTDEAELADTNIELVDDNNTEVVDSNMDQTLTNNEGDHVPENGKAIANNEDVQMSEPGKGIKIKINLRKLIQTTHEIDEEVPEENSIADNEAVEDDISENENAMESEDQVVDILNGIQESSEENTFTEMNDETQNNYECEDTDMMEDKNSRELSTPNSEETRSEDMMDNENSSDPNRPSSAFQYETVDGKPKCSFCNKLFSRKHDLKRHINNIHVKSIEYQCHLCNCKFYEAFHLTRHLRQHSSFISCTGCTKNFSAMRDLKHHINTIHEGSAASQCGACGQIFAKIKYLKDHMHEHDKSIVYKCQICNEELGESRELTKHLVGHSGMYSCSVCQRTFATEHELNMHVKVHSSDADEERKYECEICHNRYKKKRYLANHVNHCHSVMPQNVEVLIDKVESDYSYDSS